METNVEKEEVEETEQESTQEVEPGNNEVDTPTKEDDDDSTDLKIVKQKKGMTKIKIALGLKKKTVIDVNQA